MSIKSGYQYWAIKTSGENTGAIYYGREPEFEEVTKIAENFDNLIEKIFLSIGTKNMIPGIFLRNDITKDA
jgi:hypothetical protein